MIKFSSLFQLLPKQKEAASYIGKKRYIYYGGARGGGKTYLTVAIAVYCALKYPGIKIVFIRNTKRELKEEIVDRFITKLPTQLGVYHKTDMVYKFKNGRNGTTIGGSRISFLGLDKNQDAMKEQGIERHVYIVDEANNVDIEVLEKLPGSLRNTTIPNFKTFIMYTGNPGGISDIYFEKYFIKPYFYEDYSLWTERELQHKDDYIFVQAKLEDNPVVYEKDPDYVKFLEGLPDHLYKAWRLGEWGVFKGKFFDEFDPAVHIVEDFVVPDDWARWMAIDLGFQSHPSVALFFAQDPATGQIYVYREVDSYGPIDEFISTIIDKTGDNESFITRFADPAIFAEDNNVYDLSQYFLRRGLFIEKAYNKREIGWRIVKNWLKVITDDTGKKTSMIKIMASCHQLIETIPKMKYKNDYTFDINTRDLDDYVDALRYGLVHIVPGFIYIGNKSYKHLKTGTAFHLEQRDILQYVDKDMNDMIENIDIYIKNARIPAVTKRGDMKYESRYDGYDILADDDENEEIAGDYLDYYSY